MNDGPSARLHDSHRITSGKQESGDETRPELSLKLLDKMRNKSDGGRSFLKNSHASSIEDKTIVVYDKPRITILVVIGLAVACLILNIVFLVWAASRSTMGYGAHIILTSDCTSVKRLKVWLHVAINILSTVLVTGSSYCIQTLAAPSRLEVDAAHREGQSCRIGAWSISNLFRISWAKRLTILGLAFSSLTLHVVYNATILSSISSTSYSVLGVRQSFLQGAAYDLSVFEDVSAGADTEVAWIQSNLSSFVRLDNEDCLTAYFNPLPTNRGDLVLVLDDANPSIGSNNSILTWKPQCIDCAGSLDWLCTGVVPHFIRDNSTSHPEPCTINLVRLNLQNADHWVSTGGLLGDEQATVSYCLSQPVPGRCALEYNRALTIVVIVWTAFKIAMMIIAAQNTGRTFITVGDAIYSYLESPDTLCKSRSVSNVQEQVPSKAHRRWIGWLTYNVHSEMGKAVNSLQHPPPRGHLYWFQTVSVHRLGAAFSMLVVLSALGGAFIGVTTAHLASLDYPTDFGHLVGLGFGSVSGYQLIQNATHTGIAGNSVIANLPQILVAAFYFLINGILSIQLAEREWSRFGSELRRLRTTLPSNEDMAYYLSMPYSYSGPLIIIFIFLHLGLSQSLFAIEIDLYTWNGKIAYGLETTYNATRANEVGETVSTLCASTSAAIFTMMGLAIVMIIVASNSLRKFRSNMPFPGTQSIVIAAATHTTAPLQNILGRTMMWRRSDVSADGSNECIGTFEPDA